MAGADSQTLLDDLDSQVRVWPDASGTQADPATPSIEAFAAFVDPDHESASHTEPENELLMREA